MIESIELRLGKLGDARRMALMSRDLVERGLPWSWDAARIEKEVRCRDSVVLTAWVGRQLVGFAIMHFREQGAHLNLLAVDRCYQRGGIGRRLIAWLEKSALVAGTFIISLEVRVSNRAARLFYRKLGYADVVRIPGYYSGREAAMRMSRDLRRRSLRA